MPVFLCTTRGDIKQVGRRPFGQLSGVSHTESPPHMPEPVCQPIQTRKLVQWPLKAFGIAG